MFEDVVPVIRTAIHRKAEERSMVLIAIDGRCAAGKTSLAASLAEFGGCNILHMDHFFLRPEQRTVQRLREAGGNVDYERFLEEVLIPLRNAKQFEYRPFDCRRQEMAEAIRIEPKPVNIIEGSYSCHPALRGYYDLTVFLSVSPEEQLRRIRVRNGEEGAARFQDRWIPLEENYFQSLGIPENCDLRFQT